MIRTHTPHREKIGYLQKTGRMSHLAHSDASAAARAMHTPYYGVLRARAAGRNNQALHETKQQKRTETGYIQIRRRPLLTALMEIGRVCGHTGINQNVSKT